MKTRSVRLAASGEARLVREISSAAYIPAYHSVIGAVPKPAYEDYEPRIRQGQVWLLEIRDTAIGVLVLEPKADHLLVYSVAVRPSEQRKGYARCLLAFAEAQALRQQFAELRLYTNARMSANLRLYRSCGFVEIGTRPHPSQPGEVLVDLAKAVAGNTNVAAARPL